MDAVLDITGYFLPASAGPRGLSAWDTIPSGQTVTGNFGVSGDYTGGINFSVSLPAKAPAPIPFTNVNFDDDVSAITTDDDATCTGTAAAPTAPAGTVCIYPYGIGSSIAGLNGFQANNLGDQAFYISWDATAGSTFLFVTWAYTAP